MQKVHCSLQSGRLFGDGFPKWRRLDEGDWRLLLLPDHLADQVFRIIFAKTPAAHLFEILVSEQCPKDAYTHLGRGLAKLKLKAAVVNIIHGRSPNAHLMLWEGRYPNRRYHLDLDFSHLSSFDNEVISCLDRVSPHKLENLFRLVEGRSQSESFFRTLKRHMTRIPCTGESAWHALVDLALKLIFLIFVQRKGWLNFDPFYLESKMAFCHVQGLSIIHCFFKPLFARLEGTRLREIIPLGTLPRLGGGLFHFQPETLPPIPNEWCLDLYRTLVSRYSFSLFEAREGRQVVGIGPEMLGHVFENLLFTGDRKTHGIFYTPPEVAEKQVKSAFEAWLEGKPRAELKRSLEHIRILDPSCGSGTYLVAAFQVLLKLRLSLAPKHERYNGKLYALKRSIMLENLFGIDINPMAVRLTEVRLWLNMIQDLEIAEPSKAPALPNLQHHLRPGDFLSRHLGDHPERMAAWPKYPLLDKLRKKFPASCAGRRREILKHIYRLERELHDYLTAQAFEEHKGKVRTRLAQKTLPGHEPEPEENHSFRNVEPDFPLHIVFSKVFLEGGFDLVLGNPPWLGAAQIPALQKKAILRALHPPPGLVLRGQVDLSLYFLAASLPLLKPGGHLGFLMPGKLLQARFASTVRAFLGNHYRLDYLFDYGIEQNLLFKADTFPLALGLTHRHPPEDHLILVERHGKDLHKHFQLPQSVLARSENPWLLCPEEVTLFERTQSWPHLKDRPFTIQRGVVTHAKKTFVFEKKPPHLPCHRLKPLLRGRDLQNHHVAPGRWIYWPFDDGPLWFDRTTPREKAWLRRTGKLVERGPSAHLSYTNRETGPWILVWKYLASRWCVALLRADWIPDQTTYYINLDDFQTAYRLFCYFNSNLAHALLRALAERGKDRCFFFYAHTCREIPIPPDLFREEMEIPEERDLFLPGEAPAYAPAGFAEREKEVVC